jgi:hypothetical protein
MEEKEFQEQVNRKFIRPTYRPFDDKPKKIFIRDNQIPTYKIPKPNFEKTKLSLDDDSQQIPVNSLMQGRDPRAFNDVMSRPTLKTKPIHLEKMVERIPSKIMKPQPTPTPHKKEHNCCAVYEDIQNCPVCKTVYNQKDGIYIGVITILAVIILLLVKKLYMELHKNETK